MRFPSGRATAAILLATRYLYLEDKGRTSGRTTNFSKTSTKFNSSHSHQSIRSLINIARIKRKSRISKRPQSPSKRKESNQPMDSSHQRGRRILQLLTWTDFFLSLEEKGNLPLKSILVINTINLKIMMDLMYLNKNRK